MNDIRFDSFVGKLEDVGTTEACVEFTEWHSKVGMDLLFYGDVDDLRRISLTKDELHCLAVICIATNFVDIDAAKIEAKKLLEKSEKRQKFIADKKSKMAVAHVLTGMGDMDLLTEDLEISEQDNKPL